jgi:hypothetical protein
MGTNTGIGIGIGIPFRNSALGGDNIYFPPELKARMIGVWDNYGKKNTDADRNIIKNKIPNAGGDLEILNAAYEGMSGCNGYPVVFGANETWENLSSVYSYTSDVTSTTIHITRVKNAGTGLLFSYVKKDGALTNIKEIPAFRVTVKGLEGNSKFGYRYLATKNATVETLVYLGNGTHELSKSFAPTEALLDLTRNAWVGIFITPMVEGEVVFDCDITIEVLPEYEGAFVTDGVNDMIISQKTLQEMGVTKELTIVSMIHQISFRNSTSVPLTNYIRPTGNIYARNQIADIGKTGIYGYVVYDIKNSTVGNSHIVNTILGDKNDYSIYTIGDLSQGKFSVQGYIDDNDNIRETSSVAHYWTFAVLGKATADEINLIIAYFNLDRTLKPDILCNIGKQGITNDNHADFNDKLVDYSGNGRDVQMNNLAWKGGSGVAAKQYETFKDWTSESSSTSIIKQIDEFTRIVESTTNGYWVSRIKRDYDLDKVYDPINVYLYQDNNFLVHECKYEVDGVKYAIPINEPVGKGYHKLEMYTKDRYTELPENAENVVLSEWYFPKSTKGSIKYSIIPSCKGGILLDGINDFGKVTGMPIYKDYTFIIEREFLNETFLNQVCLVSKSKVASEIENGGAFIVDNISVNSIINPYSFYKTTSLPGLNTFDRQIVFQSKYKYLDKDIAAGTSTDSDTLWLGTFRDNDQRFLNGAIYSLMSFPYSMSKFLIERQLKKHKLGTLYPDMVEFRPIVKSNNKWNIIEIWQGDKSLYRPTINDDKTGIYLKKDSTIGIYVKPYVGQKVSEIVYNGVSYTDLKLNSNGFYYITVPVTKSPQKIGITIEQDENYVLFNPVINSNYDNYKLTFHLREYEKLINIGDYIPKGTFIRANLYLKNNIDELVTFTFNGVNIGYRRSPYDDTAFNIRQIYNYDSPQEVNITIDEYIRYEDIVQPYPVIFQITDRNTNQRYSWGDKIKVGSSIRLSQGEKPNLLSGLYSIQSYEYEGETYSYNQLTNLNIILTKQSISLSCNKTWLLDDNEPKCILSPRLLRIPNSSYKILGYIPDISGHGNHGVIHNSAYAEGSGVNEDGSYQFDGVDDFVTIPTVTGGKQVLMKVNWQSEVGGVTLYDQRLNLPDYEFAIYNGTRDLDDNPVMAYQGRNNGQTYIDGILNSNIMASELRNITHNITITNELSLGTNNTYPVIGSTRSNTHFAQMSLYDFMLFDNISTDDKIKELNEYVGVEAKVELPPYYWDAYGKTNSDADRDVIQQRGIAVGDYDLTNYNHAYEGMSGYNAYPVVFGIGKTYGGMPSTDNFAYTVSPTTVNVTKFNITHGFIYSYLKHNGELETQNLDYPSYKIKVTGLEKGFGLHYSYLKNPSDANLSVFGIGTDGTYTIPKSFASDGSLINNNVWIGFIFTGTAPESCNVTIEVLPEYENGLAYDGVTDYSKNANIPAFTNYTYIFKRTIINIPTNAATLLKGADKTNGGAFIADYGNKWQFNFGQYNIIQGIADGINWQTVNSFNGTSINKGENTDDSGITVAKFSNGYTSMVFYKLILYPKTISLLEINFLKNLMEKDEIIDLNNPIFIKNE